MIDLAPSWKKSLTLDHPVMIVTRDWNLPRVGAFVTPPLTARQRAGAPPPRVVEFPGGVWLNTGAANPGAARFMQDNERAWAKSRAPIIVALAAQAADDWGALAARLERVEGVGGVELHLNPVTNAAQAIARARAATSLPLLAKLDLDNAPAIAADCVAAGANALVIARAPRGAIYRDGRALFGRLYGAFAKPLALRALKEITDLRLEIPLIGCGGIHSAEDVREFLAAGAVAVEIETAHWVDADAVREVCAALGD